MCLDNYGLQKGCDGDLVILQATGAAEALRLKPSRLFVISRGKIISSEEPKSRKVLINGETYKVSFSKKDFSWIQV
jgi:cytosine deaminase